MNTFRTVAIATIIALVAACAPQVAQKPNPTFDSVGQRTSEAELWFYPTVTGTSDHGCSILLVHEGLKDGYRNAEGGCKKEVFISQAEAAKEFFELATYYNFTGKATIGKRQLHIEPRACDYRVYLGLYAGSVTRTQQYHHISASDEHGNVIYDRVMRYGWVRAICPEVGDYERSLSSVYRVLGWPRE